MAQSSPQAKGNTNTKEQSVQKVEAKRKIRLLIVAAGTEPSHYGAFNSARKNVIKDYERIDGKKYEIVKKDVKTAPELVAIINAHEQNSIRSLDIFSHGGESAIYMTVGDPRYRRPDDGLFSRIREGLDDASRWGWRNAALYRSREAMEAHYAHLAGKADIIESIEADRFTKNVKVELHGCNTAKTIDGDDADNFAGDFSKVLYEAGHKTSVVIGASESSNPSINGEGKTTVEQQDYRHGKRRILRNGKKIGDTRENGHIDEAKLEKM